MTSPEILRRIARKHLPKGWRIKEGKFDPGPLKPGEERVHPRKKTAMMAVCGWTDYETKTIRCPALENAWGLFVFLHEACHANNHTPECFENASEADTEMEAEKYAVEAIKAAGVRLPRHALTDARRYVADIIDARDDAPSDEALRFAWFR